MAEKSNNSKKNKNIIIGICAALVVIAIVVVAVILATRGTKLDDSYFVSDGTKYVLTMEYDDSSSSDDYTPAKMHMVYTYSDDEVTGLKFYYQYADEASAKAAYDYYKGLGNEDAYKEITLDGIYVIMTANESEYTDLTADEVKKQVEFMEMLQNLDLDGTDSEE